MAVLLQTATNDQCAVSFGNHTTLSDFLSCVMKGPHNANFFSILIIDRTIWKSELFHLPIITSKYPVFQTGIYFNSKKKRPVFNHRQSSSILKFNYVKWFCALLLNLNIVKTQCERVLFMIDGLAIFLCVFYTVITDPVFYTCTVITPCKILYI